jgi:hypothetical protein
MPTIFMVSATTLKMIAEQKMRSCKYYRPLYEGAYAYRNGGLFDLRPLHMFFEPAEWKGKEVARFTRIVDPDVIAQLEAIKARMYPNP